MKARLISALVVVVTFAQHAAAQSLATPRDITVPEPSRVFFLACQRARTACIASCVVVKDGRVPATTAPVASRPRLRRS